MKIYIPIYKQENIEIDVQFPLYLVSSFHDDSFGEDEYIKYIDATTAITVRSGYKNYTTEYFSIETSKAAEPPYDHNGIMRYPISTEDCFNEAYKNALQHLGLKIK